MTITQCLSRVRARRLPRTLVLLALLMLLCPQTGCYRAGVDPNFLAAVRDVSMPKAARPIPVRLVLTCYENGKHEHIDDSLSGAAVERVIEESGYFKLDRHASNTLTITTYDNYDKGLLGKSFLVGLTWGIYSAGDWFDDRVDIKLNRGDGSPAFERSYAGRHYISLGWFNSPPANLEKMGASKANEAIATRTLKAFVLDLDGTSPAAAMTAPRR